MGAIIFIVGFFLFLGSVFSVSSGIIMYDYGKRIYKNRKSIGKGILKDINSKNKE